MQVYECLSQEFAAKVGEGKQFNIPIDRKLL